MEHSWTFAVVVQACVTSLNCKMDDSTSPEATSHRCLNDFLLLRISLKFLLKCLYYFWSVCLLTEGLYVQLMPFSDLLCRLHGESRLTIWHCSIT